MIPVDDNEPEKTVAQHDSQEMRVGLLEEHPNLGTRSNYDDAMEAEDTQVESHKAGTAEYYAPVS